MSTITATRALKSSLTLDDVREAYRATGLRPIRGDEWHQEDGETYADPITAMVLNTPHADRYLLLILGATDWQERIAKSQLEIAAIGFELNDYLDGFSSAWHKQPYNPKRHPTYKAGYQAGKRVADQFEAEAKVYDYHQVATAGSHISL